MFVADRERDSIKQQALLRLAGQDHAPISAATH
jgi:hypothetical protein